ncbi:dipeptidase [Marinoscillum sp. MHG1-6]|uniref:dipeptidase n=1 Tax=Marinoscillum sp. MHG1-6 TaxID=2959627 RepID=UPI002157CB60|nr:dipeptidase [Marinoscillum sp. MHG1-6]
MKIFPVSAIALLIVFLGCSGPKKKEQSASTEPTDEELMQKADELAHLFIIADGHVDLPYRMKKAGFILKKEVMDVTVETTGNFDYIKAKKGGLDAPFMSIYIPASYQKTGMAKSFADSLIEMLSKIPAAFPEKFALAKSPADIVKNFEAGVISLPLGMENGAPIMDDVDNVDYFFDRGIRYITLTHSKDNQICDSSYDTTYMWNGLSPFGEEVVKRMNEVGIMVDISHVSDSAFYDVMKITKAPVIASHSSCRHYTPGFERNMSDDMIKKLGENGGVIHINFGSEFLSKESRDKFDMMEAHLINYRMENGLELTDSAYIDYAFQYAIDQDVFADVEIVADHIDRVVELAGIDHVGFGSDFDGVGNSLPNGLKDVSMYPNIIFELLKRGYTEEDIEKICYLNTFRVWNEVIKVAEDI